MTDAKSNAFGLLKTLIASSRIPHAVIIEGEESASDTLTHHLAAACVCEGENKPCGVCKGCHLEEIGNHTDIITLNPEDGKKNISVEQIRGIREEAFIMPKIATRKVFIIESAHKMTEQAQNALLKVLEEPPQNVTFILLAPTRTMLLKTVISRCTVLTGDNASVKNENPQRKAAKQFLEELFAKNEYGMLCVLNKYEKNRILAEEFYNELKIAAVEALKSDPTLKTRAAILDAIYRECDEYINLLKTNINLSLLFSATVSRAAKLLV